MGGGITSDPDSLRYLRDTFPEDVAPLTVSGLSSNSIAVDPANNNADDVEPTVFRPRCFHPIVNGTRCQ